MAVHIAFIPELRRQKDRLSYVPCGMKLKKYFDYRCARGAAVHLYESRFAGSLVPKRKRGRR
jgi:hypothetical protein